ncbi:uncharacterized protein THITE_2140739 [Thermothielavioides terrestris NRRL 8126]|uniref:Uncharacterized protein n=1 Tax=Thermothielavioides terrestris (strain ATCC 38088 / NRRL 8126) TaxID=578455 RepID=G2QR07_THETT|nr:uncharacterized protein THITE_2140739 [Thermothielavioides terrestris NRRL 8126]AEO62459.1 hypothetical protein THITE_2140739 [Thermothielavioides terrestris NRRL 8126]
MSGLLKLLFTRLTLPPAAAIAGKTVLITGANTGLGREAARHAASLGADTIIMGVRSVAKGEAAKADIESSLAAASTGTTTTTTTTRFLIWPLDMASFASVRAFAARVRQHVHDDHGRLDIAILNAGIASSNFTATPDGWETSLQVNVLSTALLALHLLPLLQRRASNNQPEHRPHLTILTSDIHATARFAERSNTPILTALNDRAQWARSQTTAGAAERYAVTKLLDLFLAQALAHHTTAQKGGTATTGEEGVAGAGAGVVVINAVAPGFCKSELLTREQSSSAAPPPLALLLLRVVQALVARPVAEGSKTLVHAATAGVGSHGAYLDHQAIASPGGLAAGAEAAGLRDKLWAEIIAVLREVDPDVVAGF